MRKTAWGWAGWGLAALYGCGGGATPAPATAEPAMQEAESEAPASAPAVPSKEPVATGKDCAKAEGECSGGMCSVKMKNGCDQPITCDLAIVVTCKSGSDMVEAAARSRGTIAAKADDEMKAAANCVSGEIVHTALKELKCR